MLQQVLLHIDMSGGEFRIKQVLDILVGNALKFKRRARSDGGGYLYATRRTLAIESAGVVVRRVEIPDRRHDVLVTPAAEDVTSVASATNPLADAITTLTTRWRAGELRDAAFAACYFLHWQIHLHGRRFAARRFKHDARPDPAQWLNELTQVHGAVRDDVLISYFERYQFLGVIPNVNIALAAWLRGLWPLVLCEHVPLPAEVLDLQARGLRPVTLICDAMRARQPVLRKPDAFAFMTHDLEHAYKFFHDSRLHVLQRSLFAVLQVAQQRGVFAPYDHDAEFRTRFDYLISDMNTHPVHSLQYLRAILVEFHLRIEHGGVNEVLSLAAQSDVANTLRKLALDTSAQEVLARLSAGALCAADAQVIERALLGSGDAMDAETKHSFPLQGGRSGWG
ncbi:MAG: hypothetical protein HY273_10035 [Gammaproteobacteria bacterium]|nr:hypothetical protein [Gammaproteobacteria bacterium]